MPQPAHHSPASPPREAPQPSGPRPAAPADAAGHSATGPRLHGDQVAVRSAMMRGGTSRGPFFLAADLPEDTEARNRVLLRIMGSPHPLQVDGVGGGHPLTSKAGIISASPEEGTDLDFVFAQLSPDSTTVQTTANCGNMLAAALPFAIERGLIRPTLDTTTAVVRTLNTGLHAEITVRTPLAETHPPMQRQPVGDVATRAPRRLERYAATEGGAKIAGVPGTGAPIRILFLDAAGSVAPSLLPTGRRRDVLRTTAGPVEATLIDNGQPLVLLRAADLGRTGRESVASLNEDAELREILEELRLQAGELMGLGDVREKSYPKMTLLAAAERDGAVATRSFIPHVVHESIGVLAAVTVATAACMEGTVAHGLTVPGAHGNGDAGADTTEVRLGVEHPGGTFPVDLRLDGEGAVVAAGLTRTARLLMDGDVLIPRADWPVPVAAPREDARARTVYATPTPDTAPATQEDR